MDTPSDNSERPPAEYKRGACWDIERAKSAYAHLKAYDYLREYMGKSIIPEEVEGTKETESSQESVSISQIQNPYYDDSEDGRNDFEKIDKLLAKRIKPNKKDMEDIVPKISVKPVQTKVRKLPYIFGLKNQNITISKERVIPAKRPAVSMNEMPSKIWYVTEESLKEHLERHLESVKKIWQNPNSDSYQSEIHCLRRENESLKRELKTLKERMGKKPTNAGANTRPNKQLKLQTGNPITQSPNSTQEPPHRPTFAQVAKKLAEGKPESESFRVQEALRNLAGAKPLTSGTKAELKHGYSRIYIKGIIRQKYSDVKILLKELGFKVNRLINLEFIGQKILEVDPSKPISPDASPEIVTTIKTAYENRLNKAYKNTKWLNFANFLEKSGRDRNGRIIRGRANSQLRKIRNIIPATSPSNQNSQSKTSNYPEQNMNNIQIGDPDQIMDNDEPGNLDQSNEIIPETILIMGSSPISQLDFKTERQIWENIFGSED
ncbi:hypothetical protein BB560_004491 [Smittium megazygosporum]|uniref:Uncharacterized protein n=1 Tax=Smittium megazygosporum TaxID=133381 RepID=A0A2T9Z929_9FUNG|nr:hypothetical protein BB560_004491 [Smittium megazygosporum]